jgi:hypothetical protein
VAVTLAEFVKVMSGGAVVSDKLVDESHAKIDAAIKQLKGSIESLGQAGMKSAELETQLTEAKSGLEAGLAESTAAARYQKLEAVQKDVESAVSTGIEWCALAKEHKMWASETKKRIAGHLENIKKLGNADLQKKLVANLDEMKTRCEVASSVADTSELEKKMAELRKIRSDSAQRGGKSFVEKFNGITKSVAECEAGLRGIKDEALRKSAREVLDELKADLEKAAVGGRGSVRVGLETTTLAPLEELRALSKATSAIKSAISEPGSLDRELMELDGPKLFAEGMKTMNRHVVAFGANHKPISAGEALAIHRYMGADYTDMNRVSLGILAIDEKSPDDVKKKKRLERLNKLCAEALDKLPAYPKTAWPTLRAERAWSQAMINDRYAKGKNFVTGVLWSTGAGAIVDLGRAKPRFIHSIYGFSGKDVAALAAIPGEGAAKPTKPGQGKGEVLFPATAKFRVNERLDPTPEQLGEQTLGFEQDPENGIGKATINTTLKELK